MTRVPRRGAAALGVLAMSAALATAPLTATAAETAGAVETGPVAAKAPPIVGGSPAPIAEHPWVVYLANPRGDQFCGGTLAAPDKVVTAAHCVDGERPGSVQVVAGREDKRTTAGTVAGVRDIWTHPDYQSATAGADVAVLTLDTRLPQQPLPLATPADSALYQAGTPTTVLGWGNVAEGGPSSDVLRSVRVPVVADADCSRAYSQYDPRTMVCAGVPEGGKDSCQGDSGGPMVADGKLIGIVSTGNGCARPGYPGIYTRVATYQADIAAQLGT